MKKNLLSNTCSFIAGAVIFGAVGAFAATYTATENAFPVKVDGKNVEMEGYNIDGSTYFKLRDIGDKVGFDVDFQDNTILVDTRNTSVTITPSPTSVPSEDTISAQEYTEEIHRLDKLYEEGCERLDDAYEQQIEQINDEKEDCQDRIEDINNDIAALEDEMSKWEGAVTSTGQNQYNRYKDAISNAYDRLEIEEDYLKDLKNLEERAKKDYDGLKKDLKEAYDEAVNNLKAKKIV